MNLLNETIEDLKRNGKTPADVLWCGSSSSFWFTWDDFVQFGNVEYNDGYGSPEVDQDLKIVGDSWWLERHEYDGSEWWEFKSLPKKPNEHKTPKKIIRGNQ